MLVDRRSGTIDHAHVRDLGDYLDNGDALVLNNSRVVPARLAGYRIQTRGRWQGLFLAADEQTGVWEVLTKTRGKLVDGGELERRCGRHRGVAGCSGVGLGSVAEHRFGSGVGGLVGAGENEPDLVAPEPPLPEGRPRSLVDAVVLPSYREGLPKGLIEAGACAVPLVTTDVPANAKGRDAWLKEHVQASAVQLDARAQKVLAERLGEDLNRVGAILGVPVRQAADAAELVFVGFEPLPVVAAMVMGSLAKNTRGAGLESIIGSVLGGGGRYRTNDLGQGLDSLIFYPLAFYGLVGWPIEQLWQVVLSQWVIKTAWEALLTPVTYAVVDFLKRREGVEVSRTEEPAHLSLDIADLATAYLGGTTLTALAAAGRVRELVPGTLTAAATAFGWPVAPSTGWGF